MQIDDLTAGLSISFIIHLNNEELQFESRILEVYSRRHTLLAEGVFTDDKIISFRGKGLLVDLLVTLSDDKPQLFKKCHHQRGETRRRNSLLHCLQHRRKQKPTTAGRATAVISASKPPFNAV